MLPGTLPPRSFLLPRTPARPAAPRRATEPAAAVGWELGACVGQPLVSHGEQAGPEWVSLQPTGLALPVCCLCPLPTRPCQGHGPSSVLLARRQLPFPLPSLSGAHPPPGKDVLGGSPGS